MRTVPIAAALATIALTAGLGSGASPGIADDRLPAHPGPHHCTLVDRTLEASVRIDTGRTEAFAAYGDSGQGWTGGDSTFSLPLGRGATGWFFSDTFLGQVEADGSRPADSPFVNNSVVVEDRRGRFSTVTGGTPADPTAVVPPPREGSWYWIGDPAAGPRGTVQVPLLEFTKTGSGQWDFAWTANRLATLDRDTLRVASVVDLPSATGINWGSWTLEDGRFTYVYGIADPGGVRSAYVARVESRQGLAGTWAYWTGSDWSAAEGDATPVVPYVANEFSVAPFRDGYLLVTHDTSELFGSRIVARTACSPTGPFTDPVELYRTPETGAAGSYADADVYTYNAHEHPDLRRGDRLLVTYNVNSFDNVGDVYDDVSIYRPRFLEVRLTVRP